MKAQRTIPNNSIKNYYNEFLHSHMLKYRISGGNQRIKLATEFLLQNVKDTDQVLEIGCGIGLVTEQVSKRVKNGFIWACDISDQNIWYSQKTVHKKNIHFFVADVLNQFDEIRQVIRKPIDVFMFVDVIEHLPKENHFELFQKLTTISSENAKVLLTFPSEYYQRYIKTNDPTESQIVDEIITLEYLCQLAKKNRWAIRYYELKDAWTTNQYIHCVLQREREIKALETNSKTTIIRRLFGKLKRHYRRKKYITDIFKNNYLRVQRAKGR